MSVMSPRLEAEIRLLPEHMQGGVTDYIVHGARPGSFLESVLLNQLMQSFAQADDINMAAMRQWATFLYNLPRNMWGSLEAVDKWRAHNGLEGET